MKNKKAWGGARTGTGPKPKPLSEKLVYKRVGLTPAEWQRVHDLAKREKISANAALRRILNDSDY